MPAMSRLCRILFLIYWSSNAEALDGSDLVEASLNAEENCDATASPWTSWLQRTAKRKSQSGESATQSAHINASSDFYCDSHTGGSCRFWSCSESRGPTMCRSNECRCKPGYCARDGACTKRTAHIADTCNRQTGGSCSVFGCYSYRGPVQCADGACVCKAGYCTADDGTCHQPKPPISARVAPVHFDAPQFPGPQATIRTGVCFSGGGSRALSFTLGVLRALESLKLIPHVDAISSVSGGTWASAIYMFAKDVSVEELLGEDTHPNVLTMAKLREVPARLGDVATTNIASKISSMMFVSKGSTNPHDMWIKLYAEAVLKPFGLANRSQYMAANEESLQSILERNPGLTREQFMVPNPLRPKTFIMGGTMLAPLGLSATEDSAVSLQMSPDFTGSPFYPKDKLVTYGGGDGREFLVGGGFVESFAFGGSAPLSADGQRGGGDVQMEAPPTAFSLADAIGISSAAFASVLLSVPIAAKLFGYQAEEFLPVKDVWPVTSNKFPNWRASLKYQLGDGAEVDNTGMMALLQRKVPKIVAVFGTNRPLAEDMDFCLDLSQIDLRGKATNDLLDKFGVTKEGVGEYLVYNQVFHLDDLHKLLCEFQKKLRAGDPLVVQQRLEVLENEKWGIKGNWHVNMIFVYLHRSKRFDVNLPPETFQEVEKGGSGGFGNWPHFKTSHQNSGSFTSYTPAQVNLLAGFGEYMVRFNANMFEQFFQR
ncbi:unnamed protein product [Effrenium voratum]|nr:unnamed protein product [Effrenium voratum]